MVNKEQILDTISKMSITEIMELVTMIEKRFNVSSTDYLSNTKPSEKNEIKEDNKLFSISMKSVGPNKISVIKVVRSIVNLGLKEAKDLVESTPTLIKENLNKKEVESIKNKLEEVGATVEIK